MEPAHRCRCGYTARAGAVERSYRRDGDRHGVGETSLCLSSLLSWLRNLHPERMHSVSSQICPVPGILISRNTFAQLILGGQP